MKRLFTTMAALALSATAALADYRLIVPQAPGGGTSVWANVIAPHLEKSLGEKVVIEHIPGVSDIPGFNKFHNELRKDPKTIMVAHGGNAESFLTDAVDYNYSEYEPIALVNLNIIVSRRTDFDPFTGHIKFGSTSGRRPDVMGIVLLVCGPKATVQEYIDCYKQKVTFVKGMKPTEARLAALRGELNVVRETFVSNKKFIEKEKDFTPWFEHGVLDLNTGKMVKDKNFPNVPTLEEAYKAKWGKAPEGDFYNAYLLAKSWRDVLQKSLWVDKGNPNADKLRAAVTKMLQDPEAMKAIIADGGDYEWFVGKDMARAYAIISKQITEKNLNNLYTFTDQGMGIKSVYKKELIAK